MVAAAVIRTAALAARSVVDLAEPFRSPGDGVGERTDDLVDGHADHPEVTGGKDSTVDEGFDLGVHGNAHSFLFDFVGGTILTRGSR